VGLKTILAARRVMIQAYGAHKTAAVKAMVEGKVGPHCPASFLQQHSNVHVFLDAPAAAALNSA
jgi:glucosamine-6-phosphate deaminase